MIPLLFLAMAAADPSSAAAGSGAPAGAMEMLLQDCDAHKFETIVMATVDGKPHQSKVKLCGTRGQTDAAWINTLRDAIAKVKANGNMSQEMRDQIATAIDLELARLGHADSMALIAKPAPTITKDPTPPSLASLAPRPSPVAPSSTLRPLSQDYGSLPPLPEPKAVAAASAGIGSILPSLP